MRKKYEVIVKKDKEYRLHESPYVMGYIIGAINGSGANVLDTTLQYNVKYPMRVVITADEEERSRLFEAITSRFPLMVEIREFYSGRDLAL